MFNVQLFRSFLLSLIGVTSILAARQPPARPRLSTLSTQVLLRCFADSSICGATDWEVADALAKRRDFRSLADRYWRESDPEIRNGIEKVAYREKSPLVTRFMEKVLAARVDDGEGLYYPTDYLAKQCDPLALARLATGRFRFEGSLQYQTSVELFGKCGYKPAIPYLVDTALRDMSFNIVGAAEDSLRKLFPGSPKKFRSLRAMQKYYCNRAHRGGFKVSCRETRGETPE